MKSFPLLALLGFAACSRPAPGPQLFSVAPARVSPLEATPISLRGDRINYAASVDFDAPGEAKFLLDLRVKLIGPETLELPGVERVSPTEVAARVPAALTLGRYTIELSTALGAARLDDALEVFASEDGGCFSWPDLDHDGWGQADAGATVCAGDAGLRVLRPGDCLDGNPLVHSGARELCNGIDDNCNGEVDEGACTNDAGWELQSDTGNPSDDWATASSWGRGRVWIAGKRLSWRAGADNFLSVGGSCPRSISASWANPATGLVYLGEAMAPGSLVTHAANDGGCSAPQTFSAGVAGVQGLPLDDGGFAVFGAVTGGDQLELRPGGQFASHAGISNPVNVVVKDVQGFSARSLFAVGSSGNQRPTVWRMPTDGGPFADEAVQALAVPNQVLTGIWAVDDTLAYAVGAAGALLERSAAGWRVLPEAGHSLSSVRAFGPGHVYATTVDGRVLRFNGAGWQTLYQHPGSTPLNDIAGSAEDDLWAVGNDGVVLHCCN